MDERFVSATEARLGVRFPAAYRGRLLRSNGGEVELGGEGWWLHPVRDDSEPERLRRTWDDVVRQTGLARSRRGFPAGAISISGNGGGDHLVLMAKTASAPQLEVAVWDHETGAVAWVEAGVEDLFAGP